MTMFREIDTLSLDEIEDVERLTLRWLVQATMDFGFEAYEIFYSSPDKVKDVAEDVTREIVDRLAGHNISRRIFGTVDYKKARYIILPDQIIKQALFVDSKAEKEDGTATLQISQTSLEIRQMRKNKSTKEQGQLPAIYQFGDENYLTSSLFLHYHYEDQSGRHILKGITACCVPNGLLQERYNPSAKVSFWAVGRNAPSRNEDFRARVNFQKLSEISAWRVQKIGIDASGKTFNHSWVE